MRHSLLALVTCAFVAAPPRPRPRAWSWSPVATARRRSSTSPRTRGRPGRAAGTHADRRGRARRLACMARSGPAGLRRSTWRRTRRGAPVTVASKVAALAIRATARACTPPARRDRRDRHRAAQSAARSERPRDARALAVSPEDAARGARPRPGAVREPPSGRVFARRLRRPGLRLASPGASLRVLAAGRLASFAPRTRPRCAARSGSARLRRRGRDHAGRAPRVRGRRARVIRAPRWSTCAAAASARASTGRGPGFPAAAPDGIRVYVGNAGGTRSPC